MLSLLLELTVRMCVIATSAFIFSRIPVFRRALSKMANGRDKIFLTLAFGLFTLAGTYWGIEVKGAIANSRAVGAVVAGLIGGPWVGLGAGAIAGLHRWSLGGFTGFACGLSTTLKVFGVGGPAYKKSIGKWAWPPGSWESCCKWQFITVCPPLRRFLRISKDDRHPHDPGQRCWCRHFYHHAGKSHGGGKPHQCGANPKVLEIARYPCPT